MIKTLLLTAAVVLAFGLTFAWADTSVNKQNSLSNIGTAKVKINAEKPIDKSVEEVVASEKAAGVAEEKAKKSATLDAETEHTHMSVSDVNPSPEAKISLEGQSDQPDLQRIQQIRESGIRNASRLEELKDLYAKLGIKGDMGEPPTILRNPIPEVEDNDDCATAQPINCGDSVACANFDFEEDQDYFVFTLTDDYQQYNVHIETFHGGEGECGPWGSYDTYLHLYDDSLCENEIAFNDDNNVPPYYCYSTIDIVLGPGTYKILCNNTWWVTGSYHLVLDCEPVTIVEPGDNCDSPLAITLPADLPYTDTNQTTCGRQNYYDETCLGDYDGGEDIIYELTVTEAVTVNINMTSDVFMVGMLIDDTCPPDSECIDYNTSSGSDVSLSQVALSAGTYYIMIDTWPSPDCITNFDLMINDANVLGACCYGDIDIPSCEILSETDCFDQHIDAYSWVEGGTCPDACPPWECPQGATAEGEGCGNETNNGCNMEIPAFTTIACGETICGSAWTAGDSRDTDWYTLDITERKLITITASARFPFVVGLVERWGPELCDDITGYVDPFVVGNPFEVVEITFVSSDCDGWPTILFLAPFPFNGYPCDQPDTTYWMTVTCANAPALPLGACCYGGYQAPICADLNECDCDDLDGTWYPNELCGQGNPPFGCPSSPDNDLCENAEPVTIGATVYGSTIYATFDDVGTCGTTNTAPGVWYSLIGNGNQVNASLCNTYWEMDSKITVFCGGCENLFCVGGDDDACNGTAQAEYAWCTESGTEYLILVHGYFHDVGDFQLDIIDLDTCIDDPPLCALPGADFTVTAPGSWSNTTCGAGNDCLLRASEDHIYEVFIPYDKAWTFSMCEGTDWDTWVALGTSACTQDIAYDDNFCGVQSEITTYLNAGTYYFTLEALSPTTCGDYILNISEHVPCIVECPVDATPENEGCGNNTNGGCGMPEPAFGSISCGDTICGSGWADDGSRDSDWYMMDDITSTQIITITACAQFPFVFGVIDQNGPGDCDNTNSFNPFAVGEACDTVTLEAIVPAGEGWPVIIDIEPLPFNDYMCELGDTTYWMSVSCASPYGDIAGTVTDVFSDLPIEGAVVNAWQGGSIVASDSTAADGTYLLAGLELGLYDAEFIADGYFDATETDVEVLVNQVTTVDMVMHKPGYYSGVVSDFYGTPLEGVSVDAVVQAITMSIGKKASVDETPVILHVDPVLSVITDEFGQYTLILEPGTYDITYAMTDWDTLVATGIVIVLDDILADNDVTLRRTGTLTGTVDDGTDPIDSVLVTVEGVDSVLTDALGGYSICGIYDGDYNITFTHADYDTLVVVAHHIYENPPENVLNVSIGPAACEYAVGDVNGSDSYNGLDITYGVNFFKGSSDPMCPFGSCPIPPCDAFFYCGDVNGSCSYNGLDITYGVNYFKGGSDPIPCADCPPAGGGILTVDSQETPIKASPPKDKIRDLK